MNIYIDLDVAPRRESNGKMYSDESAVYIAFQINNASLCICILCLQRFFFVFFGLRTLYTLSRAGIVHNSPIDWMANAVSLFSTRDAQLFWLLTLADFTATFTPLLKHQKLLCAGGEWCVSVRRLCPCSSNFTHSICASLHAKAYQPVNGMGICQQKGFKIDQSSTPSRDLYRPL